MQALQENIKWFVLLGLLTLNIVIWYAVFGEERNILTVAFLDVGQGDAIFIEAPNGNQLLIDGGPNKTVLRELSRRMPFYDRSIDVLLATHPDQDHIGGLPDVIKRYNVEIILRSGAVNDTGVYRSLASSILDAGVDEVLARRGMVVALDHDVFLKILFPDRDVSGVDPNDASIIAQLIYGETEFLLTGDAPKSIEQYLLFLDGATLKSDVLKAGHHGSKTSSSELFVGFADPKYAVISVGKDNRYGHPHQEVLDVLGQFNIEIISTAENGVIVFESNGETVTLK